MIERLPEGTWRLLRLPGGPDVVTNSRALLDCGCSVWVGARLDDGDTCTVAEPCSDEHQRLVRRFNDLLGWSVADGGTDRDLLDVIDEILAEAGQEVAV